VRKVVGALHRSSWLGVSRPPPFPSYAVDLAGAHASLRAFPDEGLDYRHLLARHGPPLLDHRRERVPALLDAPA
jgi:hypothetical protein